jgi:putative membrane protein
MDDDATRNEEIPRDMEVDVLAIVRTILANDRTMLSYVRTSLGLIGAGIGSLQLVDFPLDAVIGWSLIAAAVFVVLLGLLQFAKFRRVFRSMDESELAWVRRALGGSR